MVKSSLVYALGALILSGTAVNAVAVWGQCGGLTYSGSTSCDAGNSCVYVNDYYSQCQPGSSGGATTTTKAATTTTAAAGGSNTACPGSSTTKFKYFGVNESGAEFGNTAWPGVLGTDYTWPSPSSVDYFIGKGFNTFRVAFLMERISPPANGLTGAFDATYLAGLKTIVSYITGKGGYAIIDPHNFMRYNNAVISSTSNFQTWWKNLSNEFKSDSKVIFDVMNEPHDIAAATVFALNQAAVTGIRSSGATSQLILVEGTSYTGAWTWTSSGNGDVFGSISDPNNNVAIEMHQYLDSDGSGTSETCVSSTIGAERLATATAWLKTKGLKGFLGEIGAGSNDVCVAAVKGALCTLQSAGGVWIGALWWAAGPWWGTYFQSIEPPSGVSIARILPEALIPFL